MKEYFKSKSVIRKNKIALTAFSISFLMSAILWFSDATPNTEWFVVLLKVLSAVGYSYILVTLVVDIREPGIRITDQAIELKVDSSWEYSRTSITNLSHVEIRKERINTIVGYQQYEFVCFKQPLIHDFIILGIRLWRTSKKGFRLDYLEEAAGKAIKTQLA